MRPKQEVEIQKELIHKHPHRTFLIDDAKQTYRDIKPLSGRITEFVKSNINSGSNYLIAGAIGLAVGYFVNDISYAWPLKRSNHDLMRERTALIEQMISNQVENLNLRYETQDLKQDLEEMTKKYLAPKLMPEKRPDLRREAPKYREPGEEEQEPQFPKENIIEAKGMWIA